MNNKLKTIRCSNLLSQREMSKRLNTTIITYNKIELSKTSGSVKFWTKFQKEFGIPDMDMWGIINDND